VGDEIEAKIHANMHMGADFGVGVGVGFGFGGHGGSSFSAVSHATATLVLKGVSSGTGAGIKPISGVCRCHRHHRYECCLLIRRESEARVKHARGEVGQENRNRHGHTDTPSGHYLVPVGVQGGCEHTGMGTSHDTGAGAVTMKSDRAATAHAQSTHANRNTTNQHAPPPPPSFPVF
jgi:hypothetical protein